MQIPSGAVSNTCAVRISARLRSVKSSTKATPWLPLCSKLAMPMSTGTRLPSFRKYSFSNGCKLPVVLSSGTHWRTSRSSHSGGVSSVQRSRLDTRSSRLYPTMRRKASLASVIRPSRLQMKMPMMLESTRRRTLASNPLASSRRAISASSRAAICNLRFSMDSTV